MGGGGFAWSHGASHGPGEALAWSQPAVRGPATTHGRHPTRGQARARYPAAGQARIPRLPSCRALPCLSRSTSTCAGMTNPFAAPYCPAPWRPTSRDPRPPRPRSASTTSARQPPPRANRHRAPISALPLSPAAPGPPGIPTQAARAKAKPHAAPSLNSLASAAHLSVRQTAPGSPPRGTQQSQHPQLRYLDRLEGVSRNPRPCPSRPSFHSRGTRLAQREERAREGVDGA